MQYPGIESKRNGQRNFMLDARPIIQKSDGEIVPDMNLVGFGISSTESDKGIKQISMY